MHFFYFKLSTETTSTNTFLYFICNLSIFNSRIDNNVKENWKIQYYKSGRLSVSSHVRLCQGLGWSKWINRKIQKCKQTADKEAAIGKLGALEVVSRCSRRLMILIINAFQNKGLVFCSPIALVCPKSLRTLSMRMLLSSETSLRPWLLCNQLYPDI